MDVFSNVFYLLVIGVLLFPNEGIQAQTTSLPTMDIPTTEDTTTENPSTEDAATENPSTEDPSTEDPSTEDPSTEDPSTEDPSTEDPSTEDPSTEDPTSEDPTSEASTTEAPVIPGQGIPIYDDCVDYYEKGCPTEQDSPSASPYFIKARNAAGYEPDSDICKTEEDVAGCSGVGWTSIGTLEASSSEDQWSYENETWTAKGDDQIFLNSQFWSANVTEICLTSDAFNIQIPVAAPSLRSLFFGKRILDMTPEQWVDSLTISGQGVNPVFTAECSEIGFNVGDESEAAPRARLGIISTDGEGCPGEVNAIGVGLRVFGETGSVHGVFKGNTSVFRNTYVFVRSRHVDEIPSTTEPQTTEPQTTEPETTEPQTTEPQTTEPETTETQTTEPQTTEPQTTEPPTED